MRANAAYLLSLQQHGDRMARTTHRSSSGRKLYAKRKKSGEFEDIQTFKRAHGSDIKRSSAPERAAKKKSTKKKSKTKSSKKRSAKKKTRST
jgi:hypothetical protein